MHAMFERLGLIGCGLMGGSFALACKQARVVRTVIGYSRSQATTQRALQLGVIDERGSSVLRTVTGCDLVLLAVPVATTEAVLKSIRRLLTPATLVLDVGSTKTDVAAAAERVLQERAANFVPCHPIAGSERSGVENASADLYRGSRVIVTPTERTPAELLDRTVQLWEALGSDVLTMSPEAHDAALAAVSHLPHLLAFALMTSLGAQPGGRSHMALAGPGFRDFTRIAASDPRMWRDILLANRDELAKQTARFRNALRQLSDLIATGEADGLQKLIEEASTLRSGWQNGRTEEAAVDPGRKG